MKISTLSLVLLMLAVPRGNAADAGSPKDYQSYIRNYVTLQQAQKHPEYAKLYLSFSKPSDVLIGQKGEKRVAVLCSWGAARKDGSVLLMVVNQTFLIDEGFISEVPHSEKVIWVGGRPKTNASQADPPTEPASLTPPAAQEQSRQQNSPTTKGESIP